MNTRGLDNNYIIHALKLLIDIVDVKSDDKKIYIPKYRENVVLPVNRYFNDDSYVNINIFLASIIGYDNYNKMIKVKDFRDIMKHMYIGCVYIPLCDIQAHVGIHFGRIYIKTDNYIDYILDKYSS